MSGMYLLAEGAQTTAVATLSKYHDGLRVQLVDVQDSNSPTLAWELNIEGKSIGSRQIGNTLYIVTHHQVKGWEELFGLRGQGEQTDQYIQSNEQALATLQFEALGAKYKVNNTELPLTRDCYFPEGRAEHQGYLSMTYITQVDLVNKTVSSSCVGGSVETLSMSSSSAYLAGTYLKEEGSSRWGTVVHKFGLNNGGPIYQATGTVDGTLTLQGDSVSRMHEHDGRLRVLTTNQNFGDKHRLYILEDDAGELIPIATLPNENRPLPIGKEGERVYSVRFTDDKAFVVTFRRTDPLYTIDLSDPLDPNITGALEIPGFSTYMHPFGDNYVFTIGLMEERGPTGVRLFDVSGNEAIEVSSFNLDISNDALYNLNAISLLQIDEDTARVVLPSGAVGNWDDWWLGLSTLEITGLSGGFAKVEQKGTLIAESSKKNLGRWAPSPGGSRGLMHDDAVFFSHGGATWGAYWGEEESVQGPTMVKSCLSAEQEDYSVSVKNLSQGIGADMCAAEVLASFYDDTQNVNGVALLEPLSAENPDVACKFTHDRAANEPSRISVTAKMDGWMLGQLTDMNKDENYCGHAYANLGTIYAKPTSVCLAEAMPYAVIQIQTNEIQTPDECDATLTLTVDGRDSQGAAIKTYTYSAIPVTELSPELREHVGTNTACVIQADHKELFSPQQLHFLVEKSGYEPHEWSAYAPGLYAETIPCSDVSILYPVNFRAISAD